MASLREQCKEPSISVRDRKLVDQLGDIECPTWYGASGSLLVTR